VSASFDVSKVEETDLLERRLADRELVEGAVKVSLRPFQILTLRLSR
jgi:alpha-mannosidase